MGSRGLGEQARHASGVVSERQSKPPENDNKTSEYCGFEPGGGGCTETNVERDKSVISE